MMPVVEFEEEELPREEEINMDLKEDEGDYEEDAGSGDEDENGNILPEVTKKEPLYRKEDIFVKQNQPDPVKPPKKKRVLSEEHKKKLAVAREKALATRKRNAEEKKRIKELEKKAKQKKTKELEDYVDEKPHHSAPVVAKVQEKIIEREPTLTKKDIEEAQLEAIIKYETLRKARKKKKQEDMAEEKKKEETRQAIRRATQPRQNITRGQQGFWDDMY